MLEPDWDEEQDRPPFTWKGRDSVARPVLGLGASVYELPAGASKLSTVLSSC
jgi:hypothetical protein